MYVASGRLLFIFHLANEFTVTFSVFVILLFHLKIHIMHICIHLSEIKYNKNYHS